MPTPHQGRHEHGQNFLVDRATIHRIVDLVAATSGPIIEIGPGRGAITRALTRLARPVTAIEIDGRLARDLGTELVGLAEVVHSDFLHYRLPHTPHVVVGNLPFHLTTAILRRVLHAPGWTHAVLLVQWEVARRRAGIGGTSMMTAQWSPWVSFGLAARVPAGAFSPRPGVDGGLLTMRRRAGDLPLEHRRAFQEFMHRVYTGRGQGLAQILARNTAAGDTREATAWLRRHGLSPDSLPGALSTDACIALFEAAGAHPPLTRGGHRSGQGPR